MKKIVIPAILAATVLIAGMFAFMPVQKASTVHTSISGGQVRTVTETAFDAAVGANAVAVTCNAPFQVLGANVSSTDPTDDDSIALATTTIDQDGAGATYVATAVGVAVTASADALGAGSQFIVDFGASTAGTNGIVSLTYTGATVEVDATNISWQIITTATAVCS